MKALLKKEFALCMHPASVLFVFLGALVLVPNYPAEVACFFSGLGAFFICLTARENGDAAFTVSLPVKKEQVAYARILHCTILQALQIAFMAICTALKCSLFPTQNYAGMDAGIAFFGEAFLLYGLFDIIFFPWYFSDVTKVGVPFIVAGVAQFVVILIVIVLTYVCPFVRDCLDNSDASYLGAKLGVLFVGLALYLACAAAATVLSGRAFKRADVA